MRSISQFIRALLICAVINVIIILSPVFSPPFISVLNNSSDADLENGTMHEFIEENLDGSYSSDVSVEEERRNLLLESNQPKNSLKTSSKSTIASSKSLQNSSVFNST